ncbi:MAG: acetoacetate--CoA ligase [Planctomycetes bacterium]|nr:acetoacetate--CoA ligase [Planctomycetota bacterium]
MTQDARLLWQPTDDSVRRSQMHAFMTEMAARYGFEPDWPALHRWSVHHRDRFWREMLDVAEVRPTTPAKETCRGSGMLSTEWFPGIQLNFAAHLLRFADDRVAIAAEDELGRTRSITYRQLNQEVARLASAMRAVGIERGDRVGGFLPNIPEAVIGMLATASIGAVWSSCSPDFGVAGVLDRFGQIEPKMLIAADGYSYNGKAIDTLERVAAIVERIPTIETVVVVGFMTESPDVSNVKHARLWSDFCAGASGQISRPGTDGGAGAIEFEPVPFDHPLYIMYSSGTTGVPKCIVHGAGGTLLQHMKELMLHTDVSRDDTIFYFTTCGWMMWNWLVSALGVGATVALYEGSPGYPTLDHLWDWSERIGISVFGTSPKFITACENGGIKPGAQHDLARLRAVLSTGSPLTVENFDWVYREVKENLQLSSICGGTDIISCFMLGNPMLPVYAGEIQCLGLGMDVRTFDQEGREVGGDKAELVCCAPFPSQPTGFWNDPDDEKYRKAYFERFDGVWHHGDFVEITARGGVIVYGRSDATLNPGGVRIGTAEIYRQVESMEEIVDSVVVGKRTPDADVDVCLFVVLREGATLGDDLIKNIRDRIVAGTTRRHVPKHIKQVTAVPYTISGKKVELAVTQTIHGEPVLNRDALANPEALDQYAGIV